MQHIYHKMLQIDRRTRQVVLSLKAIYRYTEGCCTPPPLHCSRWKNMERGRVKTICALIRNLDHTSKSRSSPCVNNQEIISSMKIYLIGTPTLFNRDLMSMISCQWLSDLMPMLLLPIFQQLSHHPPRRVCFRQLLLYISAALTSPPRRVCFRQLLLYISAALTSPPRHVCFRQLLLYISAALTSPPRRVCFRQLLLYISAALTSPPRRVCFRQLLLGLLLLVFGILALLQGASQAYLGGGLWGGVCVIVSGTLGIMSSRRPCTYFYLVGQM